MNIGLLAVDSNYPNLALMKISSYHKARGDKVGWYNPFDHYDKVYMAKVFSFTEDYRQWITNADQIEKGGTGYDIKKVLLPEIDRMIPDYDLYNVDKNLAYGFLTRGCPNRCKWCVVPAKEGNIAPYMDIAEVSAGRKNVILMDNNVLASEYGLQQIEKIISMGVRVDFNQGLDARLVTDGLESTLSMAKRIKAVGMKFLLDFHYSDTWADPGQQATPASWSNIHGSALEGKVYSYSNEVIKRFMAEGVCPDMVQVGNEINNGMMWPQGKITETYEPFVVLLRCATAGVRAANPDIKIMIHIACEYQ